MMDPKMDEKGMKLASLMALIKEMKGMESQDLPGKPKVMAVDIHAEKLPGQKPEMEVGHDSDESSEDPMHEAMESPEFEKGEEEGEQDQEMEPSDGSEHSAEDLLSKLPPELQKMIAEHLSGRKL